MGTAKALLSILLVHTFNLRSRCKVRSSLWSVTLHLGRWVTLDHPHACPSFPSPDVPCQDLLANLDAFFAEPTPQLLHKLQGPCPGLSLTPSRRTPSRAMSSCSTASETNCKRVTHRSLSCRVATLLVRLPPPHIPRHHSTTPHQVVIWLPRLRFELHIYTLKRKLEEKCLFGFLLPALRCVDRLLRGCLEKLDILMDTQNTQ